MVKEVAIRNIMVRVHVEVEQVLTTSRAHIAMAAVIVKMEVVVIIVNNVVTTTVAIGNIDPKVEMARIFILVKIKAIDEIVRTVLVINYAINFDLADVKIVENSVILKLGMVVLN